ncbi:Hint domain-containing protein [uncultured Tateyamaria sp.]|uniref:Hint domain-containing protein n=1 Tax=uncultured Tateyamaria sp. TaxID=455651 RepID=UPI00261A4309|nr:Hint domain-containing protein [uncultured Tateyamaria sp.]
MAQIAHYTFDDGSGAGTLADSAGPTSEDGVYQGDATPDGAGAGQFDGDGDYAEVPADPAFGLDEGTVIIGFTQASASPGDRPFGDAAAQTLFSVDSKGLDGGGHLTIYITSSGEVAVRHQTDTAEYIYSGGNVVLGQPVTLAYSWGPTGSQLVVNGAVVDNGTIPLSLAGDVEPITIGASQASSGDGTANNMTGFFHGEVEDVQIHDDAAAGSSTIMCFTAGTWIHTPKGQVPVEQLAAGDVVWTCDHGPLPLVSVHSRTISAAQVAAFPNLRPIRIAQPEGAPDLSVSRQHCIAVWDGPRQVLVRAAHLEKFGGQGFSCEGGGEAVTYVHLEFGVHALIVANGILAESLLPDAPALTGRPLPVSSRACRQVLTGKQARILLDRQPPRLVRPELLAYAV